MRKYLTSNVSLSDVLNMEPRMEVSGTNMVATISSSSLMPVGEQNMVATFLVAL